MAAGTLTHGLTHTLIAGMAAMVIAAPALVERLTPPFTAVAPLPDTQAVLQPTVPGSPGGIRPGALETLPGLVDAEAQRLMTQQHSPGTALAIVHNGKMVMLRAYGIGDVERATPVDAARTLFRVGS